MTDFLVILRKFIGILMLISPVGFVAAYGLGMLMQVNVVFVGVSSLLILVLWVTTAFYLILKD